MGFLEAGGEYAGRSRGNRPGARRWRRGPARRTGKTMNYSGAGRALQIAAGHPDANAGGNGPPAAAPPPAQGLQEVRPPPSGAAMPSGHGRGRATAALRAAGAADARLRGSFQPP
ncbi:hypothetical protein [Tahibacter harae]|uniref:Uncharacterized protein n=1 Tax=Tahibacter harae TaxID=2963937 RepID=A0ABT1QXF1_9GAMM|nr:hypothetical protein [Tahibacter harae]MCQ4166955.1 hypothetical protein [Tahibacter harae]